MSDDGLYTTDAAGNRVLHGLTLAETAELERLWEAERVRHAARPRYIELAHRHRAARLQAVRAAAFPNASDFVAPRDEVRSVRSP
jgi:hypothetical protein